MITMGWGLAVCFVVGIILVTWGVLYLVDTYTGKHCHSMGAREARQEAREEIECLENELEESIVSNKMQNARIDRLDMVNDRLEAANTKLRYRIKDWEAQILDWNTKAISLKMQVIARDDRITELKALLALVKYEAESEEPTTQLPTMPWSGEGDGEEDGDTDREKPEAPPKRRLGAVGGGALGSTRDGEDPTRPRAVLS